MLPALDDAAEVHWSRLAAEMKANIRVGLAAGECVRAEVPDGAGQLWRGARFGVALASVAALLAVGVVLERPGPERGRGVARDPGVVVQAIAGGIQVSEGGKSMGLMHSGANHDAVTYQVGAQGSLEARYVDAETGYVTVNTVDVE